MIQIHQEMLTKPPQSLPDWNDRPEMERKRTEEMWQTQEKKLRESIDDTNQLEIVYWVKWCARLSIIAIAVLSWLLFALNKLRWKKLLPATTLLLIIGYAIFYPAIYSGYFHMWASGSFFLPYVPWQFTIYPLITFIFAPFFLIIITIAAIYRKRIHDNQTTGAS